MDLDENTSDTIFKFLTHFVENPFTISILIILVWISYLIYKDKLHLLRDLLPYKKVKRKILTKSDLLNHQLFSDLEFWKDFKVTQLYDIDNNIGIDEAKLQIARDLLITKFTLAKDIIYNSLSKYLDDKSHSDITESLYKVVDVVKSTQYAEFKKNGIPRKFISKWYEVCRIRDTYLKSTLDGIVSCKLLLSDYDKVYMILNNINVYYAAMLSDMAKTVQSINGDLRGESYKGKVIGGYDYKRYPVPDRSFIPLVHSKLLELMSFTQSDRASIFYFHDMIGDDYLHGKYSNIYRAELNYLPKLLGNVQYETCIVLSDIIPDLKQHKPIIKSVDEIDSIFQQLLIKSNIVGLAIAPMFLNSALKGMIVIGYSEKDKFDNLEKDKITELLTEYSSLLNIYLDYEYSGFTYDT